MSNQITTTTNNNELEAIINQYLDGVQTKKGVKPSEQDVTAFFGLCKAQGLNPFKRQAYLIGYDSKNGPTFTTIVGIDGFRKIAHATGQYIGRDQTKFGFTKDGKVFQASVIVRRLVNNKECAFTSTVFYDEAVQTDYNGNPNSIWKKRPKGQLDKCAEAAALRIAFPDDFSGVYTIAEDWRKEEEEEEEEESVEAEIITKNYLSNEQIEAINMSIDAIDEWTDGKGQQFAENLMTAFKVGSWKDLESKYFNKVNEQIQVALQRAKEAGQK